MATRSTSLRETETWRRGRSGERLVARLLREKGWYVIPSYDYSGEDGDKAPKLEGRHDAFPVPDLDVSKRGLRYWAEVKTKAAATYTRATRRLEHGIPLRHYQAYRKVPEITGCDVWLFVYEEDTGEVLCGRLDDLELHKRLYCGAKMSRGGDGLLSESCVYAVCQSVRSDNAQPNTARRPGPHGHAPPPGGLNDDAA